jgi:hypothetical protein
MLPQRAPDRPTPPRRLLNLLGRAAACAGALLIGLLVAAPGILFGGDGLDGQLTGRLKQFGFTGRVESTLTQPFVRDALLDRRATPANLRKLIPRELPSGRPTLIFELGSQKHARPTVPSH